MSKFKTLFLLTYGRSGSTLLQGILNSIDGYLIRGETNLVLFQLYKAYEALDYARFHFGKDRRITIDPWFGIDRVDPPAFGGHLANAFIDHVLKPRGNVRVVGFKEIRHDPFHIASDEDFYGYIDFLRDYFPEPCFIYNRRDIAKTSMSQSWWSEEERSHENLSRCLERLEAACEKYPERSYMVDYDEYIADPDKLAGLFAFLDETFDRATIDAVMDVRHSF
ncbi:sulfotransferase family protein [Desulfovibrio inopinatus]|uniref:sulfotransferase family protein n=1 Tax=Desulfovibrio inopinatus TaxID=102109 RepID=UPI0004137516|nr:sulfotransferase [Desulfovibrio inopinatus]